MKRVLGVVCALLLSASIANAGALAENDQYQAQFDGGIAGAGGGVAGQISGAGAGQIGGGYAIASPGDSAIELQSQTQIQNDFVSDDDGNGNFAGAGWATEQFQDSGSFAPNGGLAGNGQAQGLIGGSAGFTAGGVFGVAGSAGAAGAIGGSFGLGGGAFNNQSQSYQGVYEQQSVGPNGGYVYQTGSQEFGTQTSTTSWGLGGAVAGAGVVQAGGTLASNNGGGTYMEGHGSAAGEAGAFSGSLGIASAEASAQGTQTHSYEQYNSSADGTSQQFAQGSVFTDVQAHSVSP